MTSIDKHLKKVVDKNIELHQENERLKKIKLPKLTAREIRHLRQWEGVKSLDQVCDELRRSKGQILEECEKLELKYE